MWENAIPALVCVPQFPKRAREEGLRTIRPAAHGPTATRATASVRWTGARTAQRRVRPASTSTHTTGTDCTASCQTCQYFNTYYCIGGCGDCETCQLGLGNSTCVQDAGCCTSTSDCTNGQYCTASAGGTGTCQSNPLRTLYYFNKPLGSVLDNATYPVPVPPGLSPPPGFAATNGGGANAFQLYVYEPWLAPGNTALPYMLATSTTPHGLQYSLAVSTSPSQTLGWGFAASQSGAGNQVCAWQHPQGDIVSVPSAFSFGINMVAIPFNYINSNICAYAPGQVCKASNNWCNNGWN